jgi:hypothetical protein
MYWENDNRSTTSAAVRQTAEIALPVAVTVCPGAISRAPKRWTQRAYRHLVSCNEVDTGGHFAAWAQPYLFAEALRAAIGTRRRSP